MRRAAQAALILFAILAVYSPSFRGGFLWDDSEHVTRKELRSVTGLKAIWFRPGATQQYYPLLHTAFWAEARVWGDAPSGYRIVNLCWHAGSAWLVLLVLEEMAIPGALLAALVFAVHPLNVESAAWISEQKNTLSGVFYLAAFLCYLRFDRTRRKGDYLVALGSFVCAVLTKSVTATMPAALLVALWYRRGRLGTRRDFAPLVPLFLLGLAGGLFTTWVERTLIGASGPQFALSFPQRLEIAGHAFWFYLGKLVWPAHLSFVYARATLGPPAWTGWLAQPAHWLATATAAGFLGALWAARRVSRAPLTGFGYFVVVLFPALGFVNVYPFLFSFYADHFQYQASLGIIALATGGGTTLRRRLSGPARTASAALAALGVAALGVRASCQARNYRNAETLYRATLAENPACWMAWNNLGNCLADDGRTGPAIASFQQALRLRPDYPEALLSLGGALVAAGRADEALPLYARALILQPANAAAHDNLANLLRDSGQTAAAREHYEAALRLRPRFPEAENNFGLWFAAQGDLRSAIGHYEKALEFSPGLAEPHSNLAVALARQGRLAEALVEFEAAMRLAPADATIRTNFGIGLMQAGRDGEAESEFREALRLQPDQPAARDWLERARRMR